jgi:hypothetical protein
MTAELRTESRTVATLNARAELRRLRMLVGTDPAVTFEIDRLEEVLSGALQLTDEEALEACESTISENYVLRSEYEDLEKDHRQLKDEIYVIEGDRDEARARLEELLQAATDKPDEVLSRLTEALGRIDRLQAVLHRTEIENNKFKHDPLVSRVERALRDVFPGHKSKVQLEQHRKTVTAIRAALEGRDVPRDEVSQQTKGGKQAAAPSPKG